MSNFEPKNYDGIIPPCPSCGSDKVQLYEYNAINNEPIFFCHTCEHVWNEKYNLTKYKNTANFNRIITERKKFEEMGKITDNEYLDIIIDLYEFGGNQFYIDKSKHNRKGKSK